MNGVHLIGRLTRSPELRSAQSGTEVCRMRVAVPGRDREAEPVYVDVVCFDSQAGACAEHLSQGHRIGVEGRLGYSEWGGRRRLEALPSRGDRPTDRVPGSAGRKRCRSRPSFRRPGGEC